MRNRKSIDRLLEIRRDKSYKCDSDGNEWLPTSEFSIAKTSILLNYLDQTLALDEDWVDPEIEEDMDGGLMLSWHMMGILDFYIEVGKSEIYAVLHEMGQPPKGKYITTREATSYLHHIYY